MKVYFNDIIIQRLLCVSYTIDTTYLYNEEIKVIFGIYSSDCNFFNPYHYIYGECHGVILKVYKYGG